MNEGEFRIFSRSIIDCSLPIHLYPASFHRSKITATISYDSRKLFNRVPSCRCMEIGRKGSICSRRIPEDPSARYSLDQLPYKRNPYVSLKVDEAFFEN